MMAQATKLKKFKPSITACILAMGAYALPASLRAESTPVVKIPVLQHIGVIPVQFEADSQVLATEDTRTLIKSGFSRAVQSANRFRLINGDLVASQWQTPAGRQDLATQYHLSAFVSLNAVAKGDTVSLIARLLSPGLENYLVETETLSIDRIPTMNDAGVDQVMQGLVYRLFNRLPIDVSITSVQGKFITLSGGAQQNVRIGDPLQIVRASVAARHPANGSWVDFRTDSLGTAKIVDVNPFTSVAQVLTMTYENAVEVGDGAKIPAIAGRAKFQVKPAQPEIVDNGRNSVIVPPLYTKTKDEPATSAPKAGSEDGPPAPETPVAKASDDDSSLDFDHLFDKLDYVHVAIGPRLWSTTGKGTASAKFPMWLFNHAEVLAGKALTSTIKGEAGLELNFGPTNKGSFFGFGLLTKAMYENPIVGVEEVKNFRWRAGGEAAFHSLAVSKESFGGGDYLELGGFGGIAGSNKVMDDVSLGWETNLHLYPVAFGRIGAAGTKESIKASFGWLWDLGAHVEVPAHQMEWGGMLRYGSTNYAIGSNLITLHEFAILGTLGYHF